MEILKAERSAIEVSSPVGGEEGIFEEKPIPNIPEASVQDSALVTGVIEHDS